MRVSCSPYDRSEMQHMTRYAKGVRDVLIRRYGAANFSSDIDISGDRARYRVSVPAHLVLPVWAAIKRRRARRAA